MALLPLYGHDRARSSLARAARTGDLAQSLLLHGPAGIGKERLALWLARLLVCERPAETDACRECLPCRLVDRLEHPDVHWFFPLARPEAAGDRLREKLEEARGAELAARRADPHHLPHAERAPAYFLAGIRTIQELAGNRPAMGARKVFIVGDAELMVPQESSPEAANAFLKLLEEPPADTTLILTSSAPGALLPTVRSRLLPVRLLPLPLGTVRDFLRTEELADGAEAERVAALSGGAIGRALRLLPTRDGAGALEQRRMAAKDLLLAALAPTATARLAVALATAPSGGRGDFRGVLEAFALWLRDLLATVEGVPETIANLPDAEALSRIAQRAAIPPLGIGRALDRVYAAIDLASGNVNPQLVLADLLRGVRSDLLETA